MKVTLRVTAIFLVMLFLVGCGEPRLDTTNTTTLKDSLSKMLEDKPERERMDITKAMMDVYVGEIQKKVKYEDLAKDEDAKFIYSIEGVLPAHYVIPSMTASGVKEFILQEIVLKAGAKLNKATADDVLQLSKPVMQAAHQNELENLNRALLSQMEAVERREAGIEKMKTTVGLIQNKIKGYQSVMDNIDIQITELEFPSLSSSRARAEISLSVINRGSAVLQELFVIAPWKVRSQKHNGQRWNVLRSNQMTSAGLKQGQSIKIEKASFSLGFSPSLDELKPEEIEVIVKVYKVKPQEGDLITEGLINDLKFNIVGEEKNIRLHQNLKNQEQQEVLNIQNKINGLKKTISNS